MKLFYDYLVDREDWSKLIHETTDPKERIKLMKLIDETIHNAVLDVIFSHLDEKHHEEFLLLFHKEPHAAGLMVYLKEKAHPQIEEKIKEEIKKLKEKIAFDLKP